MKFVMIFGDAAVGKMTVGQELMKITDLRLFHNHMTIEPVIEIFGSYQSRTTARLREVIFGSGFFTALNDGLTSALISFLRTLVFQVAAVLLLPLIWEINGVWASIIVAEFMAMIFCGLFLVLKRKKFQYY